MIQRTIHTMVRGLFFLGMVLFLGMFALILLNIALRLGGESVRGAVELSSYLGAAALALCLPQVQYARAHAEVGLRFATLAPVLQKGLPVLVALLCLAMNLALTLELYDLAVFIHEGREVVDGFNVPSALFVAMLTLGCAGQGIVLFLHLCDFVQGLGIALFSRLRSSSAGAPSVTTMAMQEQ